MLAQTDQLHAHDFRFFIGYSGWDFDQLTEEIKEDSWIISDLQSNDIKDLNDVNLWKNTLHKMGNKFSVLSNFPEDPSLN